MNKFHRIPQKSGSRQLLIDEAIWRLRMLGDKL